MNATAGVADVSTNRPDLAAIRAWMICWCAVVVIFGGVLTGAAFSATDGPARALLALMGDVRPDALDRPLRFAIALMGAVTLGWGLTVAIAADVITRLAAATDRARGRRQLLVAMAIWYVLDSLLSIATGFALNAVSNSLLMAWFAALMLAWRSADR